MDNKETIAKKEIVLLVIQGFMFILFLAWTEITCGGAIDVLAEYIVFGVLSLVFIVAHILYIIPVRKAKKAAKQAFYDSIKNKEKKIFDDYDADVFDQYDKEPFKIDNSEEEK